MAEDDFGSSATSVRTMLCNILVAILANLGAMKQGARAVWGRHSWPWMMQWVFAGACLFVPRSACGSSPSAEVTGVEHSVGKDSVRVVVRFNAAVRYASGTATDPFRLYFDVQGTRPGTALSASSTVGDSLVQRVRLGQYQPGVTRIVLDLTRPAPYTATFMTDPPRLLIEVTRSGRAPGSNHPPASATSRAKLAPAPVLAVTPAPAPAPRGTTPAQMPPVPPQVKYQNGLLTITAPNSTLSDVLKAVAARTKATLEASPALMDQRIVVALGPASPREVLANLLQGMDYVLVGASDDPEAIREIILRPSAPGPVSSPPIAVPVAPAEAGATPEEAPGPSNPPANQSPSPPTASQAPAKTPEQLLEELRRLQEEQPNAQPR